MHHSTSKATVHCFSGQTDPIVGWVGGGSIFKFYFRCGCGHYFFLLYNLISFGIKPSKEYSLEKEIKFYIFATEAILKFYHILEVQ